MTKFGPNTIQTYSGLGYQFDEPDLASVELVDIAHALSNMCRFAGHVRRFSSVAEHSVLVSRILKSYGQPRSVQVAGLLHDAHEAYVWDAPRPLKPLLGEAFEGLAKKADEIIGKKFGVDPQRFKDSNIKIADDIALVAEAEALMVHPPRETWSEGKYASTPGLPFEYEFGRMDPRDAEIEFYATAKGLGL